MFNLELKQALLKSNFLNNFLRYFYVKPKRIY